MTHQKRFEEDSPQTAWMAALNGHEPTRNGIIKSGEVVRNLKRHPRRRQATLHAFRREARGVASRQALSRQAR
jgi:hypothetical protein